jgi:hypothetical protein
MKIRREGGGGVRREETKFFLLPSRQSLGIIRHSERENH